MPALRSVAALGTAAALAFAGVLIVAAPAHAATFEVDTLSDDPVDGDTLREMIDLANSTPGADTITFDPALFTPTGTIALDSSLPTITETLTIDGPGTATLSIARSGAMANGNLFDFAPVTAGQDLTIQDMSWDGDDTKTGIGLQIGNGGANPGNVTVSSVTVSDMLAAEGPAVYAHAVQGTLRIVDSTFQSGTSTNQSAGLWVWQSNVVEIENSWFTNNTATGNSGAIYADSVTSFSFTGGGATGNDGGAIGGVGIVNGADSVTITDAQFGDNEATGDGGAFRFTAVDLVEIENTSFSDNTGGTGGAIRVEAGSTEATITDSTFTNNEATGNGGAIFFGDNDQDITITGSTFTSNDAAGNGGAVFVQNFLDNLLRIATSTFSGNSAGSGGGLYLQFIDADAEFEIDSSTFSANDAGNVGAGLYLGSLGGPGEIANSTFDETATSGDWAIFVSDVAGASASFAVRHSTIVGPGGLLVEQTTAPATSTVTHTIAQTTTLQTSVGIDSGTPITVTWSVLSDDPGAGEITAGAGVQVETDAQLGTLANNGGPTSTRLPAASSPAVNLGDPAIAGAPATDQRGLARIVNGRIDIGAVERGAELAATGSEPSWPAALFALLAILAGTGALVADARRRPGAHAL